LIELSRKKESVTFGFTKVTVFFDNTCTHVSSVQKNELNTRLIIHWLRASKSNTYITSVMIVFIRFKHNVMIDQLSVQNR